MQAGAAWGRAEHLGIEGLSPCPRPVSHCEKIHRSETPYNNQESEFLGKWQHLLQQRRTLRDPQSLCVQWELVWMPSGSHLGYHGEALSALQCLVAQKAVTDKALPCAREACLGHHEQVPFSSLKGPLGS